MSPRKDHRRIGFIYNQHSHRCHLSRGPDLFGNSRFCVGISQIYSSICCPDNPDNIIQVNILFLKLQRHRIPS
ncbi:uncharacterized protein METZ01_LOCUS359226 [marine metagenome]|uniref:Uncharacterized protein n=1 Tax=marine metagenome TaxID=408172 RepID=A0A382S9Y6_9ZZZZ